MLGLGEREVEVLKTLKDLRETGCDFISIGQYLQPGKNAAMVIEYIKPEKFKFYKDIARKMGFTHIESGPYVRSSFMADKYLNGGHNGGI